MSAHIQRRPVRNAVNGLELYYELHGPEDAAIRHPGIVRRLVVISRQIKSSGFFPEVVAAFEQMGPKTGAGMKHSPLATI